MPNSTVTEAGMRLLQELVGTPPRSVEDLIESVGVSRTAVTEQLSELVAAGYVGRDIERLQGRGRPRHLYTATDLALATLFPGNQALVVPAMWQAIEDIGGSKLRRQVLRRVSRSMADHYKSHIKGKTPEKRLREFAKLLHDQEGNLAEVESPGKGRLLVRRRNCSYFSMFEESRAVCQLDEMVFTQVVGTRVKRIACRHDGEPCCVFEITGDD